jgi:hypothetical protein
MFDPHDSGDPVLGHIACDRARGAFLRQTEIRSVVGTQPILMRIAFTPRCSGAKKNGPAK